MAHSQFPGPSEQPGPPAYQQPQQAPPPGAAPYSPGAGVPAGLGAVRTSIHERKAFAVNGFIAIVVALALIVFALALLPDRGNADERQVTGRFVLAALVALLALLVLSRLTVLAPGETAVVQFFGRYVGTVRRTGLSATLPLTKLRKVSIRVNNFETHEIKVNDADGNPIDIAAIVVWQVADTAKATFAVENYLTFVAVQSEAALRHVAMSHPYDSSNPHQTSLRGSTDIVSAELAAEVARRVAIAGVEILEVRISQLSYAQEIAQAMLQRQQAGAIVAARERIVEGAVTIVQTALARLEQQNVVQLDNDRRAAMVSNLLVVLCGDQRATPIVNTGSSAH